jgi:hypothetical protein
MFCLWGIAWPRPKDDKYFKRRNAGIRKFCTRAPQDWHKTECIPPIEIIVTQAVRIVCGMQWDVLLDWKGGAWSRNTIVDESIGGPCHSEASREHLGIGTCPHTYIPLLDVWYSRFLKHRLTDYSLCHLAFDDEYGTWRSSGSYIIQQTHATQLWKTHGE